MKKHSLIVDILVFFVVSLFFVVPPFFASGDSLSSSAFEKWNFPFQQLIFALTGVILYFFYGQSRSYWLKIFPALISFGILLSVSLFVKFISVLFPVKQVQMNVILPSSVVSWIFCLLNFLFAAFYEEIVYRMYFPDGLIDLLQHLITGKKLNIICEIAGCLVFALAHIYMGVYAVINAFFAHIVLRFCYKKCGSIWYGFAAHFAYNVVSLILL